MNLSNKMWKHKIKVEKRKKDVARWRKLTVNMGAQASFPDSGYYYGKLEREADRLYEDVVVKLPRRKYIKLMHDTMAAREQVYYNYHVKLVCDGYTAAEMDEQMCMM
jgi:hypothetical protein